MLCSQAGIWLGQLKRGVKMTSDVKSAAKSFSVLIFRAVQLIIGRAGARPRRRLILLLSVGGILPDVRPSSAGLARGPRLSFSRFTPSRVAPHRGGASPARRAKPGGPSNGGTRALRYLSWYADLLRHGPHECTQFADDGHHDLMGVCAPGAPWSIPCAQPHLSLPPDLLKAFGHLFQPSLEMSTPLRRVAIGPGAFAQGASGMGLASLGEAALTTALASGICRRGEAEITSEWAGVVKSDEVSQFGHKGHGDGELHPSQGLEGLDGGGQAPGRYLLLECLLKALEAFGRKSLCLRATYWPPN
jgi:hypothetical protein